MVFVVNVNGKPLMPCLPVIARLLLKSGDAKVVRVTPFTIKILGEPETKHVQELTLGVDAGSRKAGFGVVDSDGNVYYASEVELRQDITTKMDRRRKYRRSRRGRKCRYRKPRFLNRRNSIKEGRLPPTLRSKIDAHEREIEFIKKILPISSIVIEVGTFDPHALVNPEVLNDPILYQRGLMYGFANAKAFMLHRDDYTCQHFKGRSNDPKLHCHHVIWRRHGGSDHPDNLLVLCETCHLGVHDYSIELNARGKRKGTLHHATHQNIINKRLLERVTGATSTFGYITKTNREHFGLPKTHANDALLISSCGKPLTFKFDTVMVKKCISKGDYQRTKGVRSQMTIPKGKIHGFKKFDKVRYRGTTCFVKGRMSTGYAVLMDIDGTKQPFKPIPKFNKMERIGARKCQMVAEITT